jgi:cytochrome d ubiquinol oxidase subunit I
VLTGLPVILAGVASAFFVVTANAWMNQPRGIDLTGGEVTGIRPWEAMFNPATPPQTVHMIVAAFMVAGFGTAAVYAMAMLRGKRDRYHRLGFLVPFSTAAILAPVQVVVGEWAAHFLADYQPLKLAAIEGLSRTTAGGPLSLGGVYVDGELHYAIAIPHALALLAHWDPSAVVLGLDQAPAALQPPVNVVHLSFQLMVAIGFGLVGLGAWLGWTWWRRGDLPQSRWFLRAAAVAGPAAVLAMEAGWVVTEVGRQPWIAYGVLLTRDAVNPHPGLLAGLAIVLIVYGILTVGLIYVLRLLARRGPVQAVAPQEPGSAQTVP